MDIFWLEQSEADVPAADDWFSASEVAQLNSFRFAKRCADWRLGRWTAKCAVALSLKLAEVPRSLEKIEISAASTGQPEVTLVGRTDSVTISLSHCNGIAICAVAFGDASLGCDLEVIEPRSDAFIADYFTVEEQSAIAQVDAAERPALITLLWSAKESALKALHVGLRADTRSVRVENPGAFDQLFENAAASLSKAGSPIQSGTLSPRTWQSLQVHCADETIFHGWWQRANDIVRTIVCAPPPATPHELRLHDVEHRMQTTIPR